MQRNNFWVPTVIATGRTAVNTDHHVYLELKDYNLENHKLLCIGRRTKSEDELKAYTFEK